MKVLVYGLNYSPELTGIGKYTGEMVDFLVSRGHECRVVTTPPYYPEWKIHVDYSRWRYKIETSSGATVSRCPIWVPNSPTTITRLLHLLSFNCSSLPVLIKELAWKPDVVFCVAPSFFSAPQVLLFRWFSRAKTWLHFQDFEICAMFGSGLLDGGKWLSVFAHSCQAFITRQFDRVSSISINMCKSANLKRVSVRPIELFPNWVDIDFISPYGDGNYFRELWDFYPDDKIIIYSGNLGKKQGLDLIVDAADRLRNQRDLKFVIVGDGASKADLVEMVKAKGLKNTFFFPLQPYERLPDLLALGDIHLVIQKRGTADTVLPSKLTGILAAGGNSILTAELETELGRLVSENSGIATLIPPEDCDALVEAILTLCEKIAPHSRKFNRIARDYAVSNLGREKVLERFEESLLALVGN